ncbi:MAG: pyridoxal phosphate-dependent aminotransferase [Paracoccaceae bacterium]
MRLSRRGDVDPFLAMDVVEAARAREAAGHTVIHMEIGQPAQGAPAAARAALARDMADGPLGYTVALGLPELRAGIAALYADRYGVDLDPARVIVTAGASGAFALSFAALFDPGDRVGLGLPCYPSYRQILRANALRPVGIETTQATRFQPSPGDVEGLDGLIVASPANPTGTMLSREELTGLVDACGDRTALISDEIYHGLEFGRLGASALEVTDEVHVIGSFSKYWAMTGWRVGWLIVPEAHVRTVERLAQNLFICPSHAGQRLALHALDCEAECRAMRDGYATSRRVLLDALAGAGIDRVAPADGAFYVYADTSALGPSIALSRRMLLEAGVAATPGVDFDPARGEGWMRFSYAADPAQIVEGAQRLAAFLSRG